jgi:hypothetical protein
MGGPAKGPPISTTPSRERKPSLQLDEAARMHEASGISGTGDGTSGAALVRPPAQPAYEGIDLKQACTPAFRH